MSFKQTIQTVTKNGPLARLCLSSFFYLTGQNVIGALGIYIAIDILGQYASGNWLATVVTIITTGAVIYVAPFGPLDHPRPRQETRLHDRRGRRRHERRAVLRQRQPHLRPRRACSSSASAWPC